MSITVSPIGYGYSSDGFQSNIKQKPKISREELRAYVKADKIYSEVAAEHPGLSVGIYNRLLAKFGFEKDKVRIQNRRNKVLQEMYAAGYSLEDMAAAIGVKPDTCRSYLIGIGLPTSKFAMLARKEEEMKAAIESSASRKEFAKKIGVGKNVAQKLMDELDAQPKNGKTREAFQDLKRSTVLAWKETYKTLDNIVKHVPFSKKQVIKAFETFGLVLW